MIVVDASAILEWLKGSAAGRRFDQALRDPDESFHAPHLLDLEVAQVLRRWTRQGGLEATVAEASLADFRMLNIRRHAHQTLLERIWQLRDAFSAYDAAYLALAEALEAPVVTSDSRLARGVTAAKLEHVQIEVLAGH